MVSLVDAIEPTNEKASPLRGQEDFMSYQMNTNINDSEDGLREEEVMTRYVNTTPHAITILADGGSVTIDSSDVSIRVASETTCDEVTFVGPLLVEIRKRKFTSVTYSEGGVEMPLPPEQEGVLYIVSRITAEALPGRSDLLMVDGTVRDDDGRIIGCTGFAQL